MRLLLSSVAGLLLLGLLAWYFAGSPAGEPGIPDPVVPQPNPALAQHRQLLAEAQSKFTYEPDAMPLLTLLAESDSTSDGEDLSYVIDTPWLQGSVRALGAAVEQADLTLGSPTSVNDHERFVRAIAATAQAAGLDRSRAHGLGRQVLGRYIRGQSFPPVEAQGFLLEQVDSGVRIRIANSAGAVY